LPAETTTTIPAATAAAIAAARARLAADSGPPHTSLPQLQLMTSGARETAVLNAPVLLTKLTFTIRKFTSGATAKTLADSAVPWPLASSVGSVALGPSATGA
jgi:hypothetical protein